MTPGWRSGTAQQPEFVNVRVQVCGIINAMLEADMETGTSEDASTSKEPRALKSKRDKSSTEFGGLLVRTLEALLREDVLPRMIGSQQSRIGIQQDKDQGKKHQVLRYKIMDVEFRPEHRFDTSAKVSRSEVPKGIYAVTSEADARGVFALLKKLHGAVNRGLVSREGTMQNL